MIKIYPSIWNPDPAFPRLRRIFQALRNTIISEFICLNIHYNSWAILASRDEIQIASQYSCLLPALAGNCAVKIAVSHWSASKTDQKDLSIHMSGLNITFLFYCYIDPLHLLLLQQLRIFLIFAIPSNWNIDLGCCSSKKRKHLCKETVPELREYHLWMWNSILQGKWLWPQDLADRLYLGFCHRVLTNLGTWQSVGRLYLTLSVNVSVQFTACHECTCFSLAKEF